MKSQNKIKAAFILNLFFSIVELIGGLFTGSIAILSDSLHDFGDATAIAISLALEEKSKKKPDATHTFGYGRYSVLGGAVQSIVLLIGSFIVICSAVSRLFNPTVIYYDGMLILAIIGVVINFAAASFTHGGHSANQKSVNLHMLEDVLGWIVVLIGSIIMRFTDWWFIDPVLSIAVAVFILIQAAKNLFSCISIFAERSPANKKCDELRSTLLIHPCILDVHHIHLWSLDEDTHLATLHVVTTEDPQKIKQSIRHICKNFGIDHVTLELETPQEQCPVPCCDIGMTIHQRCHHHHA